MNGFSLDLAGARTLSPWPLSRGHRDGERVAGDRVEVVRPAAPAADGPGSGDAFAATLLVALAQGDDLADALTRATKAALDSLA